jgi:FecR-like protein
MGARRPLIMLCMGLAALGGGTGQGVAQTPAPAAPTPGPAAGRVVSLRGQATVTRATVATPVKDKDDVFVRDRLATAEKSILQVSLGLRALVTVRELSILTITEQTGRSTVGIESGKLSFGLRPPDGAPGQLYEIRTPNAVAAVRGTVLIVETRRLPGPAPDGGPPFHSELSLLSGGPVNVTGGTSGGAVLQSNQALSVIGNAFSAVRILAPAARAAALAGLTAPRPIGPAPQAARGDIATQQQQAAAQDAKAAQDAASLGGGSDGKLTDLPDSVNKQVPILPTVQPRRCSGSYC